MIVIYSRQRASARTHAPRKHSFRVIVAAQFACLMSLHCYVVDNSSASVHWPGLVCSSTAARSRLLGGKTGKTDGELSHPRICV